ncbi:DUF47 domain-containing protein [Micromonospora echinospora]|uniref:DUF47 domain-containing protein n=1 Tax=Micromonospora echinospora TaxID=1877 RepID=UPI0037A1F035
MRRPAWRLRSRFRRLVEDLSGRSHHRVVEILLCQIDEAKAGADLAVSVADGAVPTDLGRARMVEIEHTGDRYRGDLVRELTAALTTPIDREDLFRFSRSVDDVLDNLRDYVRETDLFQVAAPPGTAAALTEVHEGLGLLRRATLRLAADPRGVNELTLAARKRSGGVRRLYQVAIADLMSGPIASDTLKRRELLRRVDVIGLCLGECVDALNDAMLKRSV